MKNQIQVIAPYFLHGTWVFDDPATDLVQEPFVSGVPEMIDDLVADIPDARSGFRLLFSAAPFPGFQRKIEWVREEMGGNWYRADQPPSEGWLCPALFRYFGSAPAELSPLSCHFSEKHTGAPPLSTAPTLPRRRRFEPPSTSRENEKSSRETFSR